MIRLTNAMGGCEGKPVALNPAHIVSVYVVFDGETRVGTIIGEEFLVKESVNEVLTALSAGQGGAPSTGQRDIQK